MTEQTTKPSGCNSNCGSCGETCASRTEGAPVNQKLNLNTISRVKKVIAVVSGKGGVGKSLVTSLATVSMSRRGYKTAIMDADITGPSIPKIFGVQTGHVVTVGMGILPNKSSLGTEIISIDLMLEDKETPVVWRGSVVSGVVKQFWTDVVWNNRDYMFVDLPPGTGDVPLTLYQSIPVDGIIIVASPQELVSMIVAKAVNMANGMNVPILGIVENMSYIECPDCKKQIKLFGESHVDATAAKYNLKVLGKIPIDPKIAELCDTGRIEEIEGDWLSGAADEIERVLPVREAGEAQ